MAKSRRPRGTGTIYTDTARGRLVGQVVIDGKRVKVYGKDRTEVQAKMNQLRKAPPSSRTAGATLTVGALLDEWKARDLDGRDRAPATVDRHRWAIDKIKADPRFAHKSVADVTVRDVDQFLDDLAAAGLARASISKIRNTLAQSFAFAVKRDDLSRNVVESSTIPPSARRSTPRRSLTPEEARVLLRRLRDEPLGLLFALSLRLGLRPGEAAGLFWQDITDNVVNVTRAVRRTGGRVEVVDDLKTATSRRTIEVPAELVEWIAQHRRAQLEQRLAAPRWADERLVFAGSTGRPLSPSTTRILLADICQRAEIPVVTPNELRHSCASLLSDIGVANEEIADLLGHTTTRMVDTHYRHRLRPIVDVAARRDWTAVEGS